MVIEIYGVEKATKNYPKKEQTIASFPTQREADEYIKREKLYQMGYASIGTREVAQETGYREIGEPLGYDPSREKRIRENERLAEQAREKIGSGQQISTAEAEVAGIKKSDLVKYNVGSLSYKDIKNLTPQQRTQLSNLGKAVASGELIQSQAASVREQIIKPQDYTLQGSRARQQEFIAQQIKAQEIAERAAQQTTAAGILREFGQLPTEYQTPQTLKSISEVSTYNQFIDVANLRQTPSPISQALEIREKSLKGGNGLIGSNGRNLSVLGVGNRQTPSNIVSSNKNIQMDKTQDKKQRPLESPLEKFRKEGVTISKEDPYELRLRKTAYNVALISETAVSNIIESAKEKPIRTAAELATLYFGGKFATQGLIKLGLKPIAATLTVGGTTSGGFLGYKEIKERGSVLSPAGAIATGVEVGTYGLVFKGIGLVFKGITGKVIQSKLSKQFQKTGKEIIPFEEIPKDITTPPGKFVSVELQARELKGGKFVDVARREGFGIKEASYFQPEYSKPEYINPNLVRQPDLILGSAKGVITRKTQRMLGKETNLPQKVEELADITIPVKAESVLTPSETIRRFGQPQRKALFFGGEPFTTTRTTFSKDMSVKFTPIDLKFGELATIKKPTPRGKPSGIKFIESGVEKQMLGYTPKLGGFREGFVQFGDIRTTVRKYIPSGKLTKTVTKVKPLMKVYIKDTGQKIKINELTKPPKKPTQLVKVPDKPIESTSGQQVLLLEQPKQAVKSTTQITEIKLKAKKKALESSVYEAKQESPFVEIVEEPLSSAARERVGLFFVERGAKVRVRSQQPSGFGVFGLAKTLTMPKSADGNLITGFSIFQPTPISLSKTLVAQQSGIISLLSPSIVSAQRISQNILQSPQQSVVQTPAQLPRQSPKQVISQIPQQEVAQFPEQIPLQDIFLDILRPKPPTIPPPVPPGTQKRRSLTNTIGTTANEQGYNVYIKAKLEKLRKGRYKSRGFVRVNEQPLTKDAALGLGASIVDRYANRSFAIRKTSKPSVSNLQLAARRSLLSKFRQSKRNPNIYVERSAFAIDSPEEVRGIPYEAIRQRRKAIANNMLSITRYSRRASLRISLLNSITSNVIKSKIKTMRFL